MLKQLMNEIYQFPLPFKNKRDGGVNSFLLKEEDGFTIVDTGFGNEVTKEMWRKAISDGIKVKKVVLTHAHPDHIGLAAWFQDEMGVPIVMSKKSYEILYQTRQRLLDFQEDESKVFDFYVKYDGPFLAEKQILQQRVEGYFEPDHCFEDGEYVKIGNQSFEALWTPGHSPDHFSFWNESNRLMFSGDNVLENISPVITILDENVNPLKDYIHTLEMLSQYQVHLALPGHGGPITELNTHIGRIRKGHDLRMVEILRCLDDGKTAGQVAKIIYGEQDNLRFYLTFSSTLSRLIYLEGIGKVFRKLKDGQVYFHTDFAEAGSD